jgi:choline-sulfatase
MKKMLIISLIHLCFSSYGSQPSPNFLFIFADDMAFETIAAYSQTDIDTPHLNRLVQRGTHFSHAYNMGAWNGAVCIASRTMLLSGKTVWNAHKLDSAKKMGALAKNGQTWPQWLKQAGYRTYMSGKWHIKNNPHNLFDRVLDVRPGMPADVLAGYNRPLSPDHYATGWKPWDPTQGGFWEGGTHWSEILAEHSITFLKEAASRPEPFFMYLAFNAPHDPRQAPKSYIDRYPLSRIPLPATYRPTYPYEKEMGCGPTVRDERLAPFPRTEYAVKVNRQEYYALITHMDDQIGKILTALDQTGKADSTYIIFTADHGLAVGHHGLLGKQNLYEHSTKVPFIICGPNIQPNQSISTPIYLQDILPTTLELAGIENEDQIEFKSLLPLLRGETADHYPSIYGGFKGVQRSITLDGWKLIHYTQADIYRLYHLAKDPLEQQDLISQSTQATRIAEMKQALIKLSTELNDPLDYANPQSSWEQASLK